jgi:hypothetical protein
LHHAIFDAYGGWNEHMHEFRFAKGPMDPKTRRYVLPNALEIQKEQPNPPIGRVDQTTIDSLDLKVGDRFGYWFDFGDDWWHHVTGARSFIAALTATNKLTPESTMRKGIDHEHGKAPPHRVRNCSGNESPNIGLPLLDCS